MNLTTVSQSEEKGKKRAAAVLAQHEGKLFVLDGDLNTGMGKWKKLKLPTHKKESALPLIVTLLALLALAML